jgi:hypothetical protein
MAVPPQGDEHKAHDRGGVEYRHAAELDPFSARRFLRWRFVGLRHEMRAWEWWLIDSVP